MKIVHVEDYFDPTAGYQINEMIYANSSYNDEIYVITSNDMSPFHKQVDKNLDEKFESQTGAKIVRLDSRFKISSRLVLKKLWKNIDEIEPDILFLHGIGDFKDFILFKKKKTYTILRDCHMSWVASRNKLRAIYYRTFKLLFSPQINKSNRYEVVFALGDEEYEYLKKLGVGDDKIRYLRHGYNSEVMFYDNEARNSIRDMYGFNKEDIVISYIGKFDKYKRPDVIFDIINNTEVDFIKKHNIKLLFIGPKETSYMEKFNDKLRSVDNICDVIIDGAKPFNELRKYYSASDICIFPKETTLSSIHAQVCGCTVVMEKHKSNIERVISNSNLYEIDDIVQAKEILVKIINDKDFEKKRTLDKVHLLHDREYSNQISMLRSLVNSKNNSFR